MVATILIAYNFVFAICANSYMQQSHPEMQFVFATVTLFNDKRLFNITNY
jgi:hypothetical protein